MSEHKNHNHNQCAHLKSPLTGEGPENNKNIIWAIVVNIGIAVSEIIVGVLIGSLALISDALHNFSDVGSMILSWWAEKAKEKKATTLKTYGYKRIEVIIALFNATTLLVIIFFVFVEAVRRLSAPGEIASSYMIWMALVALAGNGFATYLLEKDAHKNLNMKSAWMHSLQDALFSLGVVVGAVLIYYFHWYIIDPIISILLSVYVLKEVYRLLKETVNILMESVPKDIDFDEVRNALENLANVKKSHDLHIWQTDSNSRFLSVHLEIENAENGERNKLLFQIQSLLSDRFRISHTTIQMVSVSEAEKLNIRGEHCN